MKRALIAAFASALLAVLAQEAWAMELADMSPDAIAAMVDVRSFPNSIGPRRQDELKTFGDYGFTDVKVVDGTAELYEPDQSWMFAVTILDAGEDSATLCILDRALGGPTYHTQKALLFRLGAEGLLVATEENAMSPDCPARP